MGKQCPTRRKLALYFNWSVKVQCTDRIWTGVLMGVDRHYNLVLHQAYECRYYKVKHSTELKEIKRLIGLVVIRGDEVMTVTPLQLQAEKVVYVHAHVKKVLKGKGKNGKEGATANGTTNKKSNNANSTNASTGADKGKSNLPPNKITGPVGSSSHLGNQGPHPGLSGSITGLPPGAAGLIPPGVGGGNPNYMPLGPGAPGPGGVMSLPPGSGGGMQGGGMMSQMPGMMNPMMLGMMSHSHGGPGKGGGMMGKK